MSTQILDLTFLLFISILIFFRYYLISILSKNSVDHFYWLLCVNSFKKHRKLPIELKNKFLLEYEKQYYPPGFAIFLSFFSYEFLKNKGSYYVPFLIDILSLIFILFFLLPTLNQTNFLIIICIFFSYPVLVAYNFQLTSRGLGNLFYICSVIPLINYIENKEFFLLYLAFSSIFFSFMLITHKMTTQYFLMLLITFLLLNFDVEVKYFILCTIFGGIFITILLTGFNFFKMQMLHHAEIVLFWFKHWKNLGAHQIKDSKFYNDKNFKSYKFHQGGIKGLIFYLKITISYMPYLLLIPFTYNYFEKPLWLEAWLLFSVSITFLTLFIPVLRCIGAGHLYLFNCVTPMTIYIAYALNNNKMTIILIFLIISTIGILVGIYLKKKRYNLDIDLKDYELIKFLNTKSASNVAVLPAILCDKVGFYTNHSVLWGNHGYGFKMLEPFWPILNISLIEILKKYNIKFVSINIKWWPEGIDLLNDKLKLIYSSEDWIVFEFK